MTPAQEDELKVLRAFKHTVMIQIAPPAFDIHPQRKIEAYDKLAEICYEEKKK